MPAFSFVDMQTGAIVGSIRGREHEAQVDCPPGCAVIGGGFNDVTHMFDGATNTVVERPVIHAQTEFTIAADGADSVALPIPAGSYVRINWEDVEVDDGVLEISSPIAMSFDIFFKPPFPHQEQRLKVVAQ